MRTTPVEVQFQLAGRQAGRPCLPVLCIRKAAAAAQLKNVE